MKNLITPEQVISLAFGDGDYISAEVVTEADITLAQHRYISPILGVSLCSAALDEMYDELVNDYIAPALAFAVRVLIQPALNVRCGQTGLVAPSTPVSEAATSSAAQALQRSLERRRDGLLKRLSDHLAEHVECYPEYNPKADAMKKCQTYGGFIQIH